MDTRGIGSATGAVAGAAVTSAGTSTMRKSGASTRRPRQGKSKPGSPRPWPPRVRLNSSACVSRESSSATASRVCSRLMRRLGFRPRPAGRGDGAGFRADGGVGAALEPMELKRAPSALPERCCWRGAGRAAPCAPVAATGPSAMTLPKHLGDVCESHPVHFAVQARRSQRFTATLCPPRVDGGPTRIAAAGRPAVTSRRTAAWLSRCRPRAGSAAGRRSATAARRRTRSRPHA